MGKSTPKHHMLEDMGNAGSPGHKLIARTGTDKGLIGDGWKRVILTGQHCQAVIQNCLLDGQMYLCPQRDSDKPQQGKAAYKSLTHLTSRVRLQYNKCKDLKASINGLEKYPAKS
jgi:hypothetical protein